MFAYLGYLGGCMWHTMSRRLLQSILCGLFGLAPWGMFCAALCKMPAGLANDSAKVMAHAPNVACASVC
jgi:hypothetical protein